MDLKKIVTAFQRLQVMGLPLPFAFNFLGHSNAGRSFGGGRGRKRPQSDSRSDPSRPPTRRKCGICGEEGEWQVEKEAEIIFYFYFNN